MNNPVTDLVFNAKQQREAINRAARHYDAVAQMELPNGSETAAEQLAMLSAAVRELSVLAAAQKEIFDAASRVPDFPRDGGENAAV